MSYFGAAKRPRHLKLSHNKRFFRRVLALFVRVCRDQDYRVLQEIPREAVKFRFLVKSQVVLRRVVLRVADHNDLATGAIVTLTHHERCALVDSSADLSHRLLKHIAFFVFIVNKCDDLKL